MTAQASIEKEQCPATHQMSKSRLSRADEQWHYEGEHMDEGGDVEEWEAQADGTFTKLLTSASTEDQQASATHPINEETTERECGTPGCDLADGHLELCSTQQVTGPRQRRPLVSVQTGQAKGAEEVEEVEEVEEAVEVVAVVAVEEVVEEEAAVAVGVEQAVADLLRADQHEWQEEGGEREHREGECEQRDKVLPVRGAQVRQALAVAAPLREVRVPVVANAAGLGECDGAGQGWWRHCSTSSRA